MCKVALLMERSYGNSRELIFGISRYSSLHNHWELLIPPSPYLTSYLGHSTREKKLTWFKDCNPDGVIMMMLEGNEGILKTGVSAIIGQHIKEGSPDLPHFKLENYAIGKMAAEDFINRGFKRLAYCGFDYFPWSQQRYEGFSASAEQHGIKTDYYGTAKPCNKYALDKEPALIMEWLETLPKPVGILTANDDRGRLVTGVCKTANILVPEEIAVMGVDNDQIVCMISNPPLSSVCLTSQKAGYEAAAMLDKIMKNEEVENKEILIAPTHVVTRHSTNIMAIEDREIAKAVQFIRQNTKKPIQGDDVAQAIAMPRRTMERHFLSALGRSAYKEIAWARAEHISRILLETNMTISLIAEEFGFSDATHVTRFFKEIKGLTPVAYRKQFATD
ncbi:MAG: hypothetical protein DRP56_08260 [Planctomycetota bacterium]|nr:MAG: hypothetical protein DRP56_08260 [Planctomycetota bacterium]